MDTPGWITIEHVVQSYMNEIGDPDMDNFERFAQIVIEGISDLNIYHFYKVTTYLATVNDIGVVKLPPDYIDYLVIGRVINGRVEPLGRNDRIALPAKETCGIMQDYSGRTAGIYYPSWQEYTQGGGWAYGQYRIDKEKRLIVLQHTQLRGEEIYIEYVSTGISVDGKTMIDRAMLPVVKEYLNYILIDRSSAPANEKQRAYYMFGEKFKRYSRKRQKVTASEILDAIRSGYTMGPKR